MTPKKKDRGSGRLVSAHEMRKSGLAHGAEAKCQGEVNHDACL